MVPGSGVDDRYEFNRQLLALCGEDMDRTHYRKETPIQELFAEDRQARASAGEALRLL